MLSSLSSGIQSIPIYAKTFFATEVQFKNDKSWRCYHSVMHDFANLFFAPLHAIFSLIGKPVSKFEIDLDKKNITPIYLNKKSNETFSNKFLRHVATVALFSYLLPISTLILFRDITILAIVLKICFLTMDFFRQSEKMIVNYFQRVERRESLSKKLPGELEKFGKLPVDVVLKTFFGI